MESGILIRNLRKKFSDQVVLDGIDLTVARGEQRVILGRSGQGKSVLLKLLVGLMPADEGSIQVDGLEVTTMGKKELYRLRHRFSMVFQGGALFDSMTLGENVSLGLKEHTDLEDAQVRNQAMEALEMVGLEDSFSRMPSELSGGMKKRASLARAIVTRPDYILYDEPTTGLDPITADSINQLILRLEAELGVTSLVVTHDMTSAFAVGERFALLNNGKIVFDGDAQQARSCKGGAICQFIEGRAEGPLENY